MLRIFFLILVLMSSVAFAQTEEKPESNEKPKASKSVEFGIEPNGYVKAVLDSFFVELMNDPMAQGNIITYGPNREVARREKIIRNQIYFRRLDSQRITFVTGGFSKEIKTEFWIVPKGAEPPKIIPTAKIFAEIGMATNQKFKKLIEEFYIALGKEPLATGYIINYGKVSDVTKREKQIRNSLSFRRYDANRIDIVNGGKSKVLKTVIWIVPQGAEPPTP
jgi:hypothetical protein